MTPHKVLKSAYVHKLIKVRLSTYLVIAMVMLWVLIYRMISDFVPFKVALIGSLFGIAIGIGLSRIYRMLWDDTLGKVVFSIDFLGFILLLIFIAFDILHPKLVGLFVFGSFVHAASFAVATGVVYGCILGFRRNVYKILRERKVLH